MLVSSVEDLALRGPSLKRIFSLLQAPLPSPILIFGPASTGKSVCAKVLGSRLSCSFCYIDCSEFARFQHVLAAIVSKLSSERVPPVYTFAKFAEFCKHLTESVVVILDSVERFLPEEGDLISNVLNINRIGYHNLFKFVVTARVSHSAMQLLVPGTTFLPMYFPSYCREEVTEIVLMKTKQPPRFSKAVMVQLAELTVSFCYAMSKDPVFIQRVFCGAINELEGSEFVDSETSFARKSGALLRNDLPRIAEMIQLGYDITANKSASGYNAGGAELPDVAKTVVVAAYLASHINFKYDVELFVMVKSQKKRKRELHKKSHRSAPHAFPLERLVSIVNALAENAGRRLPAHSAWLYEQVNALINMNMISRLGSETSLPLKLRCDVGFDFVKSIGVTIPISIDYYTKYFE